MGDDVREWCVTFTKHVKQKRKVYQDGILHFHSSNRKAKLFDECDKLLEIKILKNDEVVKCGETLTFNAYIVDVGDPNGGYKPIPNVNCQVNEKKPNQSQNSGFLQRKRFTIKSVFSDKTNSGLDKNEAWKNNLSPSQNIIREFKKSEINKYGAMQRSTDPSRSGPTEWQVMYTTQKTQKAKKYHDGILRLKYCGTQGRQAKLFDECDQLLEVKILKNSEAIKPNETMIFHAYLVDIGDPKGDHKPIPELNCQGNDKKTTQKTGFLHQQRFTTKSVVADNANTSLEKNEVHKINQGPSQKIIEEWQVLYTTQLTQKSKKYHDGILQLKYCGSQGRQARLYDANRTLLDSRFLKKDEVIESSKALKLDDHLVDIGEPVDNSTPSSDLNVQVQGANYNEARQTGVLYEQQSRHQANRNTVSLLNENNNTQSGKLKFSTEVKSENTLQTPKNMGITHEGASQHNGCGGKDLLSSSKSQAGDIRAYNDIIPSKPLRNASTILSILKRPMLPESKATIGNVPVEQIHASKSLNLGNLDLQDQIQGQALQDFKRARTSSEDYDDELLILDEASTNSSSRSKIANVGATHRDFASMYIKLENPVGKELHLHDYNNGGEMNKGKRPECPQAFDDCPRFDLGF